MLLRARLRNFDLRERKGFLTPLSTALLNFHAELPQSQL